MYMSKVRVILRKSVSLGHTFTRFFQTRFKRQTELFVSSCIGIITADSNNIYIATLFSLVTFSSIDYPINSTDNV